MSDHAAAYDSDVTDPHGTAHDDDAAGDAAGDLADDGIDEFLVEDDDDRADAGSRSCPALSGNYVRRIYRTRTGQTGAGGARGRVVGDDEFAGRSRMSRPRMTSKRMRPVAMSTARPPVQRPPTVPPVAMAPMPMPSGSLTSIPVARSYDTQPPRSIARPSVKPPARRRP